MVMDHLKTLHPLPYAKLPNCNGEFIVFHARYRGVDKSLARPGRKKARKHIRDVLDFNKIETRAVINFIFSCKARRRRKFTAFWQKH